MERSDWRPSGMDLPQGARPADTAAAMHGPVPIRADHAPYVTAVRRHLEERDVRVAEASIAGHGSRREAKMLLCPDEDGFGEQAPVEAFVTWDEENGWALAAHQDSTRITAGVPRRMGLGVLPEPAEVAAWVAVLLAHPEVTPSREDHPFRNHLIDDPQFEAQLARYTPGA
jgi:hypothetical protein